MLRFETLAAAAPLIVAAILAKVEFFPSLHPCIGLGGDSVEIASAPWHADLYVSFTDNPALATVRVTVTDDAESADFDVIDDVDAADEGACAATPATQFIAISARASPASPVIYLSRENSAADYRIFVRSKRFSVHEAAALIVGAHGKPPRLADASL